MTTILVAEDEPSICDILTKVLETELAAIVRCEQTGNNALHAIETLGFDLAIIDVKMPEVSGYELARRAANRNIPTLLSSGHPDDDAKLKGYECPYLSKPYRINDLIHAAAEAITHADENIRRIKASLAKLEATKEGLKADLVESNQLINESKAILAGKPSPEATAPDVSADVKPELPSIPLDVIGEWLSDLGCRPKLG